jgi:hypothetical protein
MGLQFLFDDPGSAGLTRVEIGSLHRASDSIFCCDPFLPNGPIRTALAPGHYPVSVWIKDMGDWGPRVAFAAVTFHPGTPTCFFEACYDRTETTSSSGFEVDSGLACFMDGTTARMLRGAVDAYYANHPSPSFYEAVLAAHFAPNALVAGQSGAWANYHPLPGAPENVVMFRTGLGDGFYRAYWGEAVAMAEGPLLCLVADFELL